MGVSLLTLIFLVVGLLHVCRAKSKHEIIEAVRLLVEEEKVTPFYRYVPSKRFALSGESVELLVCVFSGFSTEVLLSVVNQRKIKNISTIELKTTRSYVLEALTGRSGENLFSELRALIVRHSWTPVGLNLAMQAIRLLPNPTSKKDVVFLVKISNSIFRKKSFKGAQELVGLFNDEVVNKLTKYQGHEDLSKILRRYFRFSSNKELKSYWCFNRGTCDFDDGYDVTYLMFDCDRICLNNRNYREGILSSQH